jgi:hypothetical protein
LKDGEMFLKWPPNKNSDAIKKTKTGIPLETNANRVNDGTEYIERR